MFTQRVHSLFQSVTPSIRAVLGRAARWPTPRNWSRQDWAKEEGAVVNLAAYETVIEYESVPAAPLNQLVYLRGLSRAFTRYRQECAFSSRFVPPPTLPPDESGERPEETEPVAIYADSTSESHVHDGLIHALERLAVEDRYLVRQLFRRERTQSDLAGELQISQRAVSKRGHRIMQKLRNALLAQGLHPVRDSRP